MEKSHMCAVVYVRVSTEEQAREGVSLDAQKARIKSLVNALDVQLISMFEDAGISGKTIRNREGLRRAIEATCAEKAVLVVYTLPFQAFQEHQRHPYGGRQAGQVRSRSCESFGENCHNPLHPGKESSI